MRVLIRDDQGFEKLGERLLEMEVVLAFAINCCAW